MDTSEIFGDIYDTMIEAHCQIRIDSNIVVARCLCSGIGKTRESTEQGQYASIADSARLLASDVPSEKLLLGDVIEINVNGSGWTKVRITGTRSCGAVLALTLGAVNG